MEEKTYVILVPGTANAIHASNLMGGQKLYHDFIAAEGFVARMEIVLDDLVAFHSIPEKNVRRTLGLIKAMEFTGHGIILASDSNGENFCVLSVKLFDKNDYK